jgi:hypothetical protein
MQVELYELSAKLRNIYCFHHSKQFEKMKFSYRKLNKMHIWCYKRSIFSLCVIFAQEIAAIAGGCAN